MDYHDFNATQAEFLSEFFGPGNALRWDAYCSGSMPETTRQRLIPFLDDVRLSRPVLLLPHVTESTRATTWYALATEARQARALREQLSAFVGPTYTDFTGQQAKLDAHLPAEAALIRHPATHVFRLRVLRTADRQEVHEQFERLRRLCNLHPERNAEVVRPIGRLLRDLEMATLVGNETSARQCLEHLRSRGRLSVHNLTFLQVRLLAAFERWSELRNLPTFRPLHDNRRPARVTEALIRCVYEEHFATSEINNNARECITTFRQKESSFGTLFRTRGPLHDPIVLKAWLIRAVARQDSSEAHALLAAIPTDNPHRPWAERLTLQLELTPEPTQPSAPASPIDRARQALQADQYDTAFQHLLECEASIEVVRRIILCAYEIDTLAATQQAAQFIQRVPEEVCKQVLTQRAVAKAWEELFCAPDKLLGEIDSASIPHDWLSWITRLNTSGAWPEAIEIAQQGAFEWPVAPLKSSPDAISSLAEQLIASRTPEATAIIRVVLPDLIGCFLPANEPVREFKSIYMSLLYLLALDDTIAADDLVVLERLAEALLLSAPSVTGPNECLELLEALEAVWQRVRSPRHLDWALSVLDLLIEFHVRQYASVEQFFNQILNSIRDWPRRVSDHQWQFLELLATDLGQPKQLEGLRPTQPIPTYKHPATSNPLKGRTVAIYTLTERIGHRAAQLIQRLYQGVKIQLLHDKAASDRLIQLARSADIMIVNTWDAKHAATGAIQTHRHTHQITLFPQGKSATNIANVLHKFTPTDPD